MFTTATFSLGTLRADGTCGIPHGAEERLKAQMLRPDGPLKPTDEGAVDVEFIDCVATSRRSCGARDTTDRMERVCVVTFEYPMLKSAAEFAVAEALHGALTREVSITVTRHLFTPLTFHAA